MCLFVLNVGSNLVGLDQAGGLGHYVIETRSKSSPSRRIRRGLCLLMVRPKSFKAGLVNQAFNCASLLFGVRLGNPPL